VIPGNPAHGASMKPAVERITDAVRLGLAELRPDDRVAVMSFSRESRVVATFSADLAAAERSIRDGVLGARFGGGTLIQPPDQGGVGGRGEAHAARGAGTIAHRLPCARALKHAREPDRL